MKICTKLLLAMIPVALLTACASTPKAPAPQPDTAQEVAPMVTPEVKAPPAETIAAPSDRGFTGSPLDDPSSRLAERVVYFDFDKSDIKSEFRETIRAHANYLANNPRTQVRLEGHADERGTREYNMGLGERRANAVRGFLLLQGVAAGQIQTVSYGEERPVAMGHDESSWRLNRRVEIVYQR